MKSVRTTGRIQYDIFFDQEMLEKAKQYVWRAKKENKRIKFYTVIDGRERTINQVLFCLDRDHLLLHKNGNQFDYSKDNLEILTRSEFGRRFSSKNSKGKSSNYQNVNWAANEDKWRVRFTKNDSVIYEKFLDDEEDAAYLADYFAVTELGAKHPQNFPELSFKELQERVDYLIDKLGRSRKEIKSKASQGRLTKQDAKSRYVGVSYESRRNKWYAKIKKDGKTHWAGYHISEKEAALAYNRKAVELYGEHARLNEVV